MLMCGMQNKWLFDGFFFFLMNTIGIDVSWQYSWYHPSFLVISEQTNFDTKKSKKAQIGNYG